LVAIKKEKVINTIDNKKESPRLISKTKGTWLGSKGMTKSNKAKGQ